MATDLVFSPLFPHGAELRVLDWRMKSCSQDKMGATSFADAHLGVPQVQMDHYANGGERTKRMFS